MNEVVSPNNRLERSRVATSVNQGRDWMIGIKEPRLTPAQTACRSASSLGTKLTSSLSLQQRFLTPWIALNLACIPLWLFKISLLWQISSEERCPEFGDSLLVLVWGYPPLVVGVLSASISLYYASLGSGYLYRGSRTLVWSFILCGWIAAATTAYFLIRRAVGLGC